MYDQLLYSLQPLVAYPMLMILLTEEMLMRIKRAGEPSPFIRCFMCQCFGAIGTHTCHDDNSTCLFCLFGNALMSIIMHEL